MFGMICKTNRKKEAGNVLFLILVGVMLFGALSFTVAQMLRTGDAEGVGERKASVLADEILAVAHQYRQAVQALRISNGCEDEDISFENSTIGGYTHTPVASDDCKLFHTDGGGLSYIAPSTEYGDGSDWVFNGANIVDNIGTTAPDLIAILPNINLTVCNSINDKMGITALGNDATIDFSKFTDTYTSTQTIDFASGFAAGCLDYVNSGDNYFFYQVLIAR